MTHDINEIRDWLKHMDIENGQIIQEPQITYVNVNGNVNLKKKNLTSFPFQFGSIQGNFNCSQNQLTSLEGGPHVVYGDYDASQNKLSTFEFMPEKVETLILNHNQFTSLTHFTCHVKNGFYIFSNPIETIQGFPQFSKKADIILEKKFPFLEQYIENTQNKNFKYLIMNANELISYFEKHQLEGKILDKNVKNQKIKQKI